MNGTLGRGHYMYLLVSFILATNPCHIAIAPDLNEILSVQGFKYFIGHISEKTQVYIGLKKKKRSGWLLFTIGYNNRTYPPVIGGGNSGKGKLMM